MIVPFNRRKPMFWIGDLIYLVICDEPDRGMITGVDFRESSECYEVSWASGAVTYHNEFELTREFIPTYQPDGE